MIDSKKLYKWIKAQINPYGKPFEGTVFEFGSKVMEHIEAMEKQPKIDWIPCEERLPLPKGNEEMVEVDITVAGNGKNVRVPACYFFKTCNFYVYGIGGARIKNVIAWMPKPAPYKKEGAE